MGRKTGERGTVRRIGRYPDPEAPPRSKKGQKRRKQRRFQEERLSEEQWRRVGVSGSLRGRRSEEMTQSNTSSPQGSQVLFEFQRG